MGGHPPDLPLAWLRFVSHFSHVVISATDISKPSAAFKGWPLPALAVAAWWIWDLQRQWRVLPDYQYGWIVVMLAAYLVWERSENQPAVDEPPAPWVSGGFVLLGAPLVLIAELYKWGVAPSPAASFILSIGCCLFICALIQQSRGQQTMRHYLFPLLFMFVAVPLPQVIWSPVINGLRELVTFLDVEALKILGIPAMQTGSVIQLPRCVVGVNEACSGVRSLQSSIMAALFIGDLVLKRTGHRVLFVVVGMGWAVFGNFLRSLFLSFMAHRGGTAALQSAHDTAGWSILVFTAAGLVLTAWVITRLERWARAEIRTPVAHNATPPSDDHKVKNA